MPKLIGLVAFTSDLLPSAGAPLHLDVGVRGLPEPRYRLPGDASPRTETRESFTP